MKQSEKIVGENDYDIRYKSLLIWSKYFLGKPDYKLKTLDIMQSRQEDIILMVILAILSKLKEINLRYNIPTINTEDLQTSIYLCLGKVRTYKHEFQIEFEEATEEPPYEFEETDEDVQYEDYDYGSDNDNFEGFNLNSMKKFEAFLTTYFIPLRNELDLRNMEEAIFKILHAKIPLSLKHQNLNFFISGFKLSSLE
jgi:hypothetical protein